MYPKSIAGYPASWHSLAWPSALSQQLVCCSFIIALLFLIPFALALVAKRFSYSRATPRGRRIDHDAEKNMSMHSRKCFHSTMIAYSSHTAGVGDVRRQLQLHSDMPQPDRSDRTRHETLREVVVCHREWLRCRRRWPKVIIGNGFTDSLSVRVGFNVLYRV